MFSAFLLTQTALTVYPARERGKIQGYLASVWAISALLGPVVGGLIVRNISWAWVFWINIPLGLMAAAGFIAFLHETVRRERRTIDVAGATTFAIAVTSLLIGLTEVGTSDVPLLAAAAAVSCIATVAFILQERRTDNPTVSFALWSRRPIAAANGVCLLSGMALMGLTTFVPIYAVLNHGLARATGGTSVSSDQLRQLIEMTPGSIAGDAALRLALQHSLNLTFWGMLAMAVIAAVIASMVPLVELKQASQVAAE